VPRIWFSGLTAAVIALCVAGAVSARPVQSLALAEHWNGKTWTQVAPPGGPALAAVVAPAVDDAWAFGSADIAEHWTGSAWHKVVMPPAAEFVGAAAVSPNDIWAVGDKEQGGYAAHAVVAHWTGSKWHAVSSPPLRGYSRLVAVSALAQNDVWAVGFSGHGTRKILDRTLVVHWNGTVWKRLPTPNPTAPGTPEDAVDDPLYAVAAVSPTDVWAVGSEYVQSGRHHTDQSLVLHWNGKKWSRVQSVNPGGPARQSIFEGLTAPGQNDVWAVGRYGHRGRQLPLVEHWDGTRWHVVSAPGGPLAAAESVSAGGVWAAAGGGFGFNGDVVHWNGSAWNVVPTPTIRVFNEFDGIAVRSLDDIWVVGVRMKS
jgi:hypothetical protein